ncbi:alpha-amylase family protein [Sinorhizobium psoraleae]|uniref:Alpha-amylase family protein n=1 Tax=Sinorhizobium psoraleae TaxID=520838 RepID=A0ABT4KAN2_9HYPH|nr:alpha-amylase family protein [Sinorhizobium psoraleae]MCZ4088967.1 alpha-amylase family protein [Sinorhizobium psoraleae]
MKDAPWFVSAVIYGIDVRRFADGNGDGIGDFVGLRERVPYLNELGINCVWLLPFFKSPFADNGYDVSDYLSIDTPLGTLDDFLDFQHTAGEQGIRVIIDLVANHTSNEHPWFQAARRDPRSRYRNYYVWSDNPPPVDPDNKTAFPGEEDSVWSYDELAQAYYFHKFRHFQPDLNIANTAVRDEMLRVVDYWLSMGVDGFRVDAAPFVIGETGIEHADPRDPHGFLREMRALVDARRPGGLLLGEADLAPEKLREYFGEGKLDLLFNFILSGAFFAGLARQSSDVICQALSVAPEPPPHCGWANFLRNLDELNVARQSEAVRQETYAAFAPDEDMRIYGRGIRRRLAPMFKGEQARIELAFSLLLSSPGVPVFVYGDEIGLGDDLSRPGRETVRVPMQWSDEANAGFSTSAHANLVQPTVSQGPFSYKRINVERQRSDPHSLLNRVKTMILARRRHDLFHKGRPVLLPAGDAALFALAYSDGTELLVALHNLSDKRRRAELELPGAIDAKLTDILSDREVELAGQHLTIDLDRFGYTWLHSGRKN